MNEDELIRKCITGDRRAQEELYTHYASRMKGICVRYARSVVEAEDIFQEGVVKVFNSLKHYKGTGSFEGWVRRIMVFTAADVFKKDLKLKQHMTYEEMTSNPSAVSVSFQDDLSEQDLLTMLKKLPDGYRLVFNLYAIEGFSHKEISAMLGISEGTSKSQLFKARKALQLLLEYKQV